ncbi:MAG TPA: carboxypeptidase-like regulatory domain-containing protein [Candidatus Saccharimonadales bacterium]|nr:carboxypeptidase-like regulatory domain-containing protein [Candidatus Saccharimonadales bacterium]
MTLVAPRQVRRVLAIACCAYLFSVLAAGRATASQSSPNVTSQSRDLGQPVRIPRQQAFTTSALDGIVRESGSSSATLPVPAAQLSLRNLQSGETFRATASGEGVFRVFPLPPGHYELRVEAKNYATFVLADLSLEPNQVVTLEISLLTVAAAEARSRLPRLPELGPALSAGSSSSLGTYREFRHRLDSDPAYVQNISPDTLPPVADVYNVVPNRWALEQPDYRRYSPTGEYIYTKSRWYDPFNRNRLKGDEPIWPAVLGQQTFLNITGSSESFFDGRRVPSPSNVSAAQPGSSGFFGRGEQAFFDQTVRVAFDLFHGDAAFKPVDWRVRITPEVSFNNLAVRELGIVSPDVRNGTNRFDTHIGLQEAFVEVKLADLSPNYDFISARAGIQQFNTDFRGFLFVDEEPGLRIFGNFHSDKIEYNVAYFHFLEKNTNSGLNSFEDRHQQVILGNVYLQDFFFPGYTAEFVAAYNKDDPSLHYDDNGFLVRPSPIGSVINQGVGPILHGIRVGYFGWLGSGHIGRLNVTHAFYQAVGEDTFNPIAGKSVTVNAQMAAGELSYDKDWIRYRISAFFTSGDANPRDNRARGFDSIVDLPNFAGGLFSFWNREGIRLTGSGVLLTTPGSLIPSLRSSKEEGQANFVNPGIFLANAGADFDITPKLRGFANVNFLRFERTEPLEYLLFQSRIRHTIGTDFGLGLEYRPPLTENIILTGGASALAPGKGFQDIYTSRILFSLFGQAKLIF